MVMVIAVVVIIVIVVLVVVESGNGNGNGSSTSAGALATFRQALGHGRRRPGLAWETESAKSHTHTARGVSSP